VAEQQKSKVTPTSRSQLLERIERLRAQAKRLRMRQDDPRAQKVAAYLEVGANWLEKRLPH
jgi:hypothetical protein